MARGKRGKDRRIEKTQALLHAALGTLIRERPYDEIALKEILDRANVGRSTFYTHFRDKDELLTSAIQQMLGIFHAADLPESGKKDERIIRFSLSVFEHVHAHRQGGAAGMGTRGRAIIHEHLRQVIAEQLAGDLGRVLRGHSKTPGLIPRELLVHYVASTFVLVLNWWVESNSTLSPKAVNDLFRKLTLPTLTACLD